MFDFIIHRPSCVGVRRHNRLLVPDTAMTRQKITGLSKMPPPTVILQSTRENNPILGGGLLGTNRVNPHFVLWPCKATF